MTATQALQAAWEAGVSVRVDGVDIVLEAASPPPQQLIDLMRCNKQAVVELLLYGDYQPDDLQGAFEERSALVEDGVGVPREWAEGFARLDIAQRPCDVPLRRWRRFIDDCGRFLDSGWAARAAALGWGPLDLFGCDRCRPFARIDHAGLLWLLNGDQLVALTSELAVIETSMGARQKYRRKRFKSVEIVLGWEVFESDSCP